VSAMSVQKTICARGRKAIVWWWAEWRMGTANRTMMDASRASTPPSLLGIERRMAYANRKYHSGWMWTGVTRGLAGTKFSGSPRAVGKNKAIASSPNRRTMNPNTSL